MTTAFYVIKTYQSVFERRMRTLQFRSPGIAPGNADESAPDVVTDLQGILDGSRYLVTLCSPVCQTHYDRPLQLAVSWFGLIPGLPSHAVNGTFYVVHIVRPSCSWPSSPSLPTHLPEHHIVQPSCSWPSSP